MRCRDVLRIGGPILMALVLAAVPAEAHGQGVREDRIDLAALDDERRFDFLIGAWTYAFDNGRGEARYDHAVDGTVVRETLEGEFAGRRFAGSSLIFRDPATGGWAQRWVDSFGNVLVGAPVMGEHEASDLPAMIATFQLDGVWFRHVWYDIGPERFETDLLVSQDGTNWQLNRRAPYTRVR